MTIQSLTALFLVYKYPVIFLVTVVEGPVIMMLSGIMLRLGTVSFLPIYFTLIIGDLVGDIFWYTLGYHFAGPIADKYGKFIGLTPSLLEKTRSMFKKNEVKILFLSKITMGFGFVLAVLISAGMSKMSFKKYLAINFCGQFIWTGLLLSVGYFFGNLYTKVNSNLRFAGIIAFAIIAFAIFRGINSYLKSQHIEENLDSIL